MLSTDFRAIMSNFVATDVYALFNIHVEKSTTWLCKNEGGRGGQGPFTQCVKKHPIWYRTSSLSLRVTPFTIQIQDPIQSDICSKFRSFLAHLCPVLEAVRIRTFQNQINALQCFVVNESSQFSSDFLWFEVFLWNNIQLVEPHWRRFSECLHWTNLGIVCTYKNGRDAKCRKYLSRQVVRNHLSCNNVHKANSLPGPLFTLSDKCIGCVQCWRRL